MILPCIIYLTIILVAYILNKTFSYCVCFHIWFFKCSALYAQISTLHNPLTSWFKWWVKSKWLHGNIISQMQISSNLSYSHTSQIFLKKQEGEINIQCGHYTKRKYILLYKTHTDIQQLQYFILLTKMFSESQVRTW